MLCEWYFQFESDPKHKFKHLNDIMKYKKTMIFKVAK